ncbi:ABC transporter permease [Candidatus Villigracilis saccharophilus]|uniref:ABC transporter permease n=1 Tax=Candidatus Villigracilis saccharophilus TaxID=3140684 RepID=UPI003137286D|nr:ABC transporter permease [Anaerolineales bacterium]
MIKLFPWKRALRSRTVWFSLIVMLAFSLLAIITPRVAPHDPYKMRVTDFNLPPMWVQSTSAPGVAEYPLGTDRYGRDVFSRLLYGTRTAMFLALTAVPLAAFIGTLIGLITGYAGGRIDAVFMLFTDMLNSLPGIMFLVIIVLIFRGLFTPSWVHGLFTLIVGFAVVAWVSLARLIRINVLQLKSQLFIEAAVGIGASPWRIMTRHLLPNVLHVVLVWIINNIPVVILLEAVLGYIGVGVTSAVDGGEFTVVSWGGMFFSGRSLMSRNPLMLMIPSFSILLISMSFLLLGDFLNGITRRE